MIRNKQAIVVGIAVLAATVTAFAQDSPQARGRGNPVQAAIEAFGLTEEQVDQIREIRRERPPRDQSQEERQAWLQERTSKIQAVLTDEQKGKVEEAEAAAAKMRALAGARFLGLTDTARPNPGARGGRARGPRGGRAFRDAGRFRRGTAFRRGGRGWQGPGFRGRRWGPPGGPGGPAWGRRGGPDRGDRRGRRGNRD